MFFLSIIRFLVSSQYASSTRLESSFVLPPVACHVHQSKAFWTSVLHAFAPIVCMHARRYLDSDGLNGYSNTLLLGNTSNNPTPDNVPRKAPIDAMDGAWHMITVTSQAKYYTPGYRCRLPRSVSCHQDPDAVYWCHEGRLAHDYRHQLGQVLRARLQVGPYKTENVSCHFACAKPACRCQLGCSWATPGRQSCAIPRVLF